MTLEALRQKVGSHDFCVILPTWAEQHKYGNVTTAQFIRLSERVSGQDLDAFFKAWLYTPEKPAHLGRKRLDLSRGSRAASCGRVRRHGFSRQAAR